MGNSIDNSNEENVAMRALRMHYGAGSIQIRQPSVPLICKL